MTKFNLILSLVISLSIGNCLNNKCDFKLEVAQYLFKEGFHRDMFYNLSFVGNTDDIDRILYYCVIMMEQTLPAGVYANPYELQDLSRLNKTFATSKDLVNVESFGDESSNVTVVIISQIYHRRVIMWIPLHARYQSAVPGGGFVTNEIDGPKVFLKCIDNRVEACKGRGFTFSCQNMSLQQCNKMQLHYTKLTDPIMWDIPVGNTDHLFIVAIGTLLATILGTCYLIFIIFKYKT